MLSHEDAIYVSSTTESFINEIAPQIDGWFYPLDMMFFGVIEAFHRSISASGDLAEIGVWKGKSLTLLSLLKAPAEHLYGMDLFCDDLLEQSQASLEKFVPDSQRQNIAFVKGNTADYSTAQLRQLFRRKLRLLHIDAGHEYHEVLHTLSLTAPFVEDHGIIVMDDYLDREFPGVHSATLDYCYETSKGRWVPFLVGGNKIYLANPVYAKQLQLYLCQEAYFKDSFRLSRIKDSPVLIASSKLPMSSGVISSLLRSQLYGVLTEQALAELQQKAASHSQNALADAKE
jgi:hypothetical protein